MFSQNHKTRQELQNAIDDLQNLQTIRWFSVRHDPEEDPDYVSSARALRRLTVALETFETGLILRKAERYAIDIPSPNDKPSWWRDNHEEGMPFEAMSEWLSPTGRLGVSKLVREEQRKNIEWWVRIITPILGALISLLGLVVALVTILKNRLPR